VWQEPFPLVTIEGAFARVPLVAADGGGIGEGMHDGEHALLYPAQDPGAAADAVARTLREPDEAAARVSRAHARGQDLRLEPNRDAQARFVLDAHQALTTAQVGPAGGR
jgi:glycosyltransferase involved in cell wall biosynthesis